MWGFWLKGNLRHFLRCLFYFFSDHKCSQEGDFSADHEYMYFYLIWERCRMMCRHRGGSDIWNRSVVQQHHKLSPHSWIIWAHRGCVGVFVCCWRVGVVRLCSTELLPFLGFLLIFRKQPATFLLFPFLSPVVCVTVFEVSGISYIYVFMQ